MKSDPKYFASDLQICETRDKNMAGRKGKVIKLPIRESVAATQSETISAFDLSRPKLRSNEWLRLLSIQNKQSWEYPLNSADQRDYQEIEEVQAGRILPYRPDIYFLNAACTFFRGDRLCWIQDSETRPYRELTAMERRIWDIVGIKDLLGYIRPDGSIQAFVLSGWERIEHLGP